LSVFLPVSDSIILAVRKAQYFHKKSVKSNSFYLDYLIYPILSLIQATSLSSSSFFNSNRKSRLLSVFRISLIFSTSLSFVIPLPWFQKYCDSMLTIPYQDNSASLSQSFLNYTGKSSLFQSNRISPWLKIPLGKLRVLIEPLYHLRERRNEPEQNGSCQRGSKGCQHQKRGPGNGGALKKKLFLDPKALSRALVRESPGSEGRGETKKEGRCAAP